MKRGLMVDVGDEGDGSRDGEEGGGNGGRGDG